MPYTIHSNLLVLGFILFATTLHGQVVYTDPQFPTQKDDIILYYDASKGNEALKGFSGSVYAHMGVITSNSSNDNDWQHVIGDWGKADERVKMTDEGNDLYSISYNIESFHNIQPGEVVRKLAFVFRNQDGSMVGRDTDGSDIFLDVFQDNTGLISELIEPQENAIHFIKEDIPIKLNINQKARVKIKLAGRDILDRETSEVDTTIVISDEGVVSLSIFISSESDSVTIERSLLIINRDIDAAAVRSGLRKGLNESGEQLTFVLSAPNKKHVFLLCPQNEFRPHLDYRLTPNPSGNEYWIELPKSQFQKGKNYYQYFVDGEITIADPYSTTILDPSHDGPLGLEWSSLYPDGAKGHVSVADIWEEEYDWKVDDFEPPSTEDLIIYELLMRDFLNDQSYTSLIDTLDYLQRLGINAIELMPVQEFEGNQSWGYNPSYHMALDKAYGTREDFKKLVDECHRRGIAVILDVVYNHAFSQSPLCRLYWDQTNFRPSPDNPWLNITARHPFNVGYDFNHSSPLTREWVKQVNEYWITEFKIDGFRFDLSKGFTQTNSVGNPSKMAQYDISRINILTDYAEHIWSIDDDNIVILEHFAENREELELADRGMLLWNNSQFQFAEAAMGYHSDLSGADHSNRGMDNTSLITYLESHDEERMGYKINRWGNSDASYSTKDLETLTERMVAAYTILMSIPGPKMMWQFSELAYDQSINRCVSGTVNDNCRLDPKPVRWFYKENTERKDLYEKLSALFQFKTNTTALKSANFELGNSDQYLKSVHVFHNDMNVVSIANFDVKSREMEVNFPQTGTWYEFFTGLPYEVSDRSQTLNLNPGGYKLFTSDRTEYSGSFTTSTFEIDEQLISIYPNPVRDKSNLYFSQPVEQVIIHDLNGRRIIKKEGFISKIELPNLDSGVYFIQYLLKGKIQTQKIIKS